MGVRQCFVLYSMNCSFLCLLTYLQGGGGIKGEIGTAIARSRGVMRYLSMKGNRAIMITL